MKRKTLLAVLSGLLSLVAALTVFAPSMGLQSITFARNRSTALDASPPVTYYGGPVMPGNVSVYAIFWFPGDQGDMSTYISYIKQYYQDVSGNRLYNMLSEYAGHNGTPSSTTLRGSWEDTGNPYDSTITAQDFSNEVKRAIAANNWPTGGYTNYFPVYTLPGANVFSHLTGTHLSFGPPDHLTIYGFVTYCSSGTCDVPTHPNDPNSYATDGAIDASAHEQFEAATDPGVDRGLGWMGKGEIGDLCTGTFGPTPYPYDQRQANQQWVNAQGTPDPYIIQEIMSDTPLGCILGTS
ncbi:MAG: hypothetical protein WCD86_25925 [Ktedonobacteraceae bacterium]